jgi:hypothetical protein
MNARTIEHIPNCARTNPEYCDGCVLDDAVKTAVAAERGRWVKYAKLLTAEVDEMEGTATLHGWKSSRGVQGAAMRHELGLSEEELHQP